MTVERLHEREDSLKIVIIDKMCIRDSVEAITGVAILAELPLVKKTGEGSIVVRENKNDLMEEMFRGLRTNLLFMLGKDERVILFSSTQPGEGKSFVAGNLAVSLAYLGKRVVVVGMDIRKPGLNKVCLLYTSRCV